MAEEKTEESGPRSEQSYYRRGEDFESLYANSVYFQPSEWDLKLTFGELDNKDGVAFVEQHTSIAVPWLQARLMHYFLTLQLEVFEMYHGKIKLPASLLPPEPVYPTGGIENDPQAVAVYERVKELRAQLISQQPS